MPSTDGRTSLMITLASRERLRAVQARQAALRRVEHFTAEDAISYLIDFEEEIREREGAAS